MTWYQWLWRNTTGRPFTYILRDVWHEKEWIFQTGFFALGALTFWLTSSWKMVGVLWGIYTIGYVSGHLFWGKEYQEGQSLDKEV